MLCLVTIFATASGQRLHMSLKKALSAAVSFQCIKCSIASWVLVMVRPNVALVMSPLHQCYGIPSIPVHHESV